MLLSNHAKFHRTIMSGTYILQGGGEKRPPIQIVIQNTPYGIGLKYLAITHPPTSLIFSKK